MKVIFQHGDNGASESLEITGIDLAWKDINGRKVLVVEWVDVVSERGDGFVNGNALAHGVSQATFGEPASDKEFSFSIG